MQISAIGEVTEPRSARGDGISLSRKDTIIIAMLVNMALLFVLFATATKRRETATVSTLAPVEVAKAEEAPVPVAAPIAAKVQKPIDEIDQILQQYVVTAKAEIPSVTPAVPVEERVLIQPVVEEPTSSVVEVIVKKGDVLSKIAKAHGTTVDAIMSMNKLENAKLKIGQKLKIPSQEKITEAREEPKSIAVEPEYYVIKSGDNPWKIAKKFHIGFEELLKLNNLDEAKARNLKIGQKIRIK